LKLRHYITAKDILSQHHDYLDGDIEWFQTEADHFMREWVDLHRLMGLSNYIHMFTLGHFMWFVEEYLNVSQLSQPGFEIMNAVVASFFLQRTQ
jgi:hypothetical protein